MARLDTFTQAYIEAALFTSTDDDGAPLDDRFGIDDIAPETLATMVADCDRFTTDHFDDIADDYPRAGHDFWLTRNGHGAGFWDGDWPDEVGDRLTQASKAFGEYDLYVGDDGRIYGYPG